MRVLLIATEKLPVPPVRGGAIQTYISAVAPILARSHSLTILGITDPLLPEREQAGGITVVRVPGGDLDTYTAGVREFLSKNSFDLIHVFNRPRLVATVRETAPGARIILSMHNDMFGLAKIPADEAQAAIRQLDRIITVSDYVGKTLAGLYPAAGPKLRTIYSGVDLDRFVPAESETARRTRAELRRQHQLEGKQVVLFVGRLSPKKGADVLVRALPLLARKHPDLALVLVGSKWYGEDAVSDYVAYVRTLSARAALPVVTTGFVPPEQVHQWFSVGDLFVCASQWEEPLARVHYEAMAAGLPMVTTARGGNPEVVQGAGNGVVVERYADPAAFAEAISALLSNPSRARQMGRTGRALAEERYGWSRVAAEILQVWQEQPAAIPAPEAQAKDDAATASKSEPEQRGSSAVPTGRLPATTGSISSGDEPPKPPKPKKPKKPKAPKPAYPIGTLKKETPQGSVTFYPADAPIWRP